jgi:predicted RNase H-like nuclease (RuvC/YqgF family)
MTLQEIIISIGGGAGVVGLVVQAARSPKIRKALAHLISNSVLDLTEAVNSLKSVVEAQGESIEWLRTELTSTKAELEIARLQLSKTEALAIENAALRTRVADLEAQVHKLEEELKRRRGGRPKSDG